MLSDNHTHKVRRLLNPVSSTVRAASIFPSLSRVVEELVLNSLDASSSIIEVQLDLRTFSTEVIDNGVGISYTDLRDKAGQWNSTSKHENSLSHGFRGEALAAIRMLSSLTVTSKATNCSSTYVKTFEEQGPDMDQDCSILMKSSTPIVNSGTRVRVRQLFENLPARRKALRRNLEVFKVKEFIQRMSILYHDVSWLLVDENSAKTIIKLQSQPSVSARFMHYHGRQGLHKMKSVSVSYGSFQLSGLLSPPLSNCCHWTKEYQYFFVNNRWMRGTEIIASMVDKVYVTALTSQKSGGPASKHHAPKSAQVQSHPCFVLQLTCPPDSYDVLCEPDKTMAVFSHPHLVKLCVKKLLLLMFGEYRPDLEAAVECLCGGDVSGLTEVRSRVRDMNDGSDAENTVPEVSNFYAVQAKGRAHAVYSSSQLKDTTQRFDRTVMSESPDFKSVFLSKTPPETLINGKADPHSASQPISLFAEFEFSTTPPHEEGRIVGTLSEEDKWKCDIVRAPLNSMYVQSESSSDNESSGEDSLSSGAHCNFKSKGVTVYRLPGLVESIDHDVLSEDPNFSLDENDEESVGYSVGVYDDSDSRDSDGCQFAHSQEGGRYGASHPFGSSTSSPTEYLDDSDSMELTHMALRALNADESKTDHQRKRASETHAQSQPVHANMTHFSYLDPSTGSVTGGSDGRYSNLLEESITPVERAPDLPVNLFCTEFSDAFFSSRMSNGAAKLDFNALEKHGLGSSTASTLSTIIGKKRVLEADSARYLSTVTPLDADFVSQDRRSSLLLLPRHNGADVTVKKAVAVDTKSSVKLTKNMLSVDRLRIIGQVDAKYVLARSGSLMIIIDQHAADERVKLEEMLRGDGGNNSNRSRDTEGDSGGERTIEGHNSSTSLSTIRMTGTMPLSDTIEITSSDLYVLVNRPKIFHSWGFLFDLIPEEENTTLHSVTSLKLTQVPVFYGEALNADDFIEFVHYVSDHSRWAAPHSLLKPPSLKRIAASKACRTAVKFGDILDLERCTNIMSKLSETDLPFQCAHGRPSAVPLIYLKQSRGHCISPPINSTGPPILYDAGPKYLKSPNYSRLTLLMNN